VLGGGSVPKRESIQEVLELWRNARQQKKELDVEEAYIKIKEIE